MSTCRINYQDLVSERARAIDVSGIRRIFELGAKLSNPVDLSIGQPDFQVPEPIKNAAIEAIRSNRNRYTLTQGAPDLLHAIAGHLAEDVGWRVPSDELGVIVTAGTSGGIYLACMSILNPGDEIIAPDPYFVLYPTLGPLTGAKVVTCDTYPDFRLTAERVEPLITDRTRLLLVNTPSNPCGTVLSTAELRDLVDLCNRRGVLIIADEIYDQFTYSDAREEGRFPSAAQLSQDVLLIRGFGKTYGCTGWRMGFAAGPKPVIQQMAKLQQYTYVCAPSAFQAALAHAFDLDMSGQVAAYERKRDGVVAAFSPLTDLVVPGGAFYAFVKVPARLGLTGSQFVEKAIEKQVLLIPGQVFSRRDTHFRLSFAASDTTLERGLDILTGLMTEG